MLVKFTDKNKCRNGFQFKLGLNIDSKPFNPSGDCQEGGLYCCDIKDAYEFIQYAEADGFCSKVKFPKKENVYENPGTPKKYKSHQLIFENFMPISDIETHKFLVKHGADVKVKHNSSLFLASARGRLDVVNFLVEHGADVNAVDNYALRRASENGHLDIVKYLKSILEAKNE